MHKKDFSAQPIQGPITKEYIKTLLPEKPIILEAGAHKGRDTVKMLKIWPHGTFYCFEPSPSIYQQLITAVGDKPNVHTYQLALASHNGSASFHVSSGRSDAASSLLTPQEYAQEHPDTIFTDIEVKTITLDTWAQQEQVERIDFMWLDMQGGELNMLKSGTEILKTVQVICSEVNLSHRYTDAPLYAEYKAWMESQGFYVTHEHFFKPTWGNVLFVNEKTNS